MPSAGRIAAATESVLSRSLRAYQIYGANTDVGKTVLSTILCKSLDLAYPQENVWYLKPVSTGASDQADDGHLARFSSRTKTRCLFQFDEPVSPHIAARSAALTDASILERISAHIASCSQAGPGTLLLETAGGVHSPTPSGGSQADLYRPLRLPVLLVADHRLGGISSSISAFESLRIRGYDLDSVLVFQDCQYRNYEYLRDYFGKHGISVFSVPPPPPRESNREEDDWKMSEYYATASKLDNMGEMIAGLSKSHRTRIDKLESMSTKAHKHIWHPFTQHQGLHSKNIMTIDSAHGDFFQTYDSAATAEEQEPNLLKATLDGSASWWTQGVGHGNPELSLAAAYAAGRYGHVMFAGAIHEPAMTLAELLLENMKNPRLQKAFYSDNGSTGIEVATKMALTASSERYGYDSAKGDIGVLGLKGSYHGDTIGAMDCSEPSTYNEKVHWYKGRGYWFDFPQVNMKNGTWIVEPPLGCEVEFGPGTTFSSLDEVFDMSTRDGSPASATYKKHILATLDRLIRIERKKFGALIMEPVILGAGGMLFIDPLFQRCLVQVVRENPHLFSSNASTPRDHTAPSPADNLAWSGLPVVFDEVFTGLYRLGRFTSASFLGIHPDISVHAKLLTGGLLPLCLTLASNSIYSAFLGCEKRDALLHGHSYTAHAVGCEVAKTSLQMMLAMEARQDWKEFQNDWTPHATAASGAACNGVQGAHVVWSMWSRSFLDCASRCEGVESVLALGSVLAIRLRDENSGYNSNAASGLQGKLSKGSDEFKIHSRVLGNVLYLMTSQTTKVETVRTVEKLLLSSLL